MNLQVRPMDEADARAILSWRYETPYDLYNPDGETAETDVASFADPANCYYSVRDEHGDFIAYICFGAEARVPGGDYAADALDVGCGIKPDLTGQGLGPAIIRRAVDLGEELYHPGSFRATIAAFNQRALKAAQKAGFVPVSSFDRPSDGTPFVILERPADSSAL